MEAVIATGGKQYRVSPGQVIQVERLGKDKGAAVEFTKVLLVNNDGQVTFEPKALASAKVTGQVVAERKGDKVLVVKFNDYQCPPCRQTYMEYKPILAKWAKQAPGKVKFVTKDFALERECNSVVSTDVHPSACEAAVAVRLAREKGKAEAMEEWIFANQPTLTPDKVKEGAKEIAGN